MTWVSVPAEFLGGIFLILGFATRYTLLVMLFFMIVASFSSHAYWADEPKNYRAQHTQFWKNVSMTGGAGGAFRDGCWSLQPRQPAVPQEAPTTQFTFESICRSPSAAPSRRSDSTARRPAWSGAE